MLTTLQGSVAKIYEQDLLLNLSKDYRKHAAFNAIFNSPAYTIIWQIKLHHIYSFIFVLKFTKNDVGWGFAPGPTGGTQFYPCLYLVQAIREELTPAST